MLFYRDYRATAGNCSNPPVDLTGNTLMSLTGAMYFPSQEMWYNGGGSNAATCTMFVARRIVFTGNSGVSNKFKSLADCELEGLPQTSNVKIVRLVS